MATFKNKYQMIKASDDEIREFFATTIFEGIFSKEIRSNHTDYFKGHIHSIKIAGESTNVLGSYINVPVSANEIPEGECTFKCRLKEEVRQSPSQINFSLSPKTLRSKSTPKPMLNTEPRREGELSNEDLFELWGVDDCECIGYYHFDPKSGGYLIDDLRKTNFDRIPPYLTNKKPITLWLKYPQKGIEVDNYYRFTWKLSHKDPQNPYEIYLDSRYSPQTITPKWFIDKLFEDRHSDKSKNFGSAANFLDTLSKQLSARESTFVYELLQNANDYPVEGQMVDVEFHITDNYLLFLHSGDKFNVRNISGICGINEKEKIANRKTIGYKGIGFKTVFLNNHYVYLRTGDYSFRFDQGETPEKKRGGKIKRQDAPFQILPIWTEHNEVSPEVNSIFDNAAPKFQVQIALRPDSQRILHFGRNSYENLFREVFSDSNIILFIPNINSVSVFINGKKERACFRNNEEWIVGDYENEIGEELQLLINKTIEKGNSRIPEKYKDFDYTKVSFACNHEGAMIKPVDDATLYCYLPTKASWGLPFLMNTDMIPKGDRNDIETEVKLIDEDETNFNEELASIAGSKLFLWVHDLLTSRKYQLGSVFSLVPDFKKCKREHKDYTSFIEKFEEAFNTCLETETIVPVPQGIALVNKVILDSTGLSISKIMSDDEFRKFTGMEDYYLPLPMLRKDKHFNSFLKRYADDDQIFDKDCLKDLISNDDFKEWLKDQDNNNKFLNFLLENDYLEDYLDEEIFIEEECGNLFSANSLYYDIDKELEDLSAFSSHLCYLSFKTREFFKDNEKWNEIIDGQFAEYDSESFINDTLLSDNWDETVKALKEWETSFHFYSYLAKNSIVPDDLCSLPFFNDGSEATVEDDFNDKIIFLSSSEGKKTCSASWLSSITFSFVSPNYDKATLDYFKENAGVLDYSDDVIVNDIIQSEDYHDEINESQQEDKDTSVSFVKFCYEHESLFGSGSLRDYALNSYDCDGDETFVLYEDHIFFPSECFDQYSQKNWLNCDWMYSLDSDYLKVNNDIEKVKAFLKKAFYVEELDTDKFYKDIVRPNISSIISNTSGSNDGDGAKNLDFICYLDANYNLVFDKEKDADKFESFVFIGDSDDNGFYDIASDSAYIYAYDSELKDILDSEWFPADTVNMCTSKYGESKSIQAIKAKKYDFANFFNDVITEELDNINDTIGSKDASVAFHTFIIDRLADLTDKQKEVMKGAKVYLYGNDDASDRSDGHHILSKSARELASMGLVEFSDLDIIDPDYHIEENEEYWKTRLGNEQFTVTDFITWLTDNTDTFYSTIEDKDNNIKFWRWVKGCKLADQTLANLPVLPVYLTTDEYVDSDDTIYLSDDYIEEGGLETIVKSYHPDASFISSEYVEEGDNIDTWKDFWVKMGVRFEMVDILIDTIDNRLSDTDDAKLPATIAKYRLKLEEHYEGDLISNLRDLRVKAHDGKFYGLSEVIYVDSEKEEPFKYIEIPTQASFATADERKLIIDILDEMDGDKITKLTEWQKVKIERYLEIQDDENNEDLLRSIHFHFVDELAAMYIADKDSLKEFDQISNVLFLDSDDEFTDASEMTEGSLYKPFCDFEKYGLDYEYISNSYLQECTNDIRKMLNRVFKIHCDFEKDDIENLSDRDFSIYFWSQYLIKRDADISGVKKLIEDREFDSIACIPTKDYMKKPGELYSLDISSYVIKHVDDWENKLPLKDLPNIEYDKEEKRTLFGLLLNKPSNLRLSFCDSLYALFSIAGQERRAQLLQWMIETYDEKYDVNVTEYRADESAKWKNAKNDDKPISELYALSYNDKKLEQYFGNLPQIINKDYLPAGPISFKNACDILQIITIEPKDLIVDKIGQVSKNEVYKKTLRVYALVLAGYEDAENWSSRYQKYCELIDALELWCCTAISIRYEKDENICQNLKKFYREKGSADFYFVKSLDEKRVFKPFVENFIEYLGIEADKDFVETVMDSRESAMELVQENNTLMLDDAFKDELDLLIPGIKRELNGNEADDTDLVDEDKRHTFTGHTDEPEDDTSEDDNLEDNVSTESDDTENSEGKEDQNNEIECLREEEYDDDDEREAIDKSDEDIDEEDFCNITKMYYNYNGEEIETVCEHYRNGTWVRGHYRNGIWVNGYWRSGSNVSSHTRSVGSYNSNNLNQEISPLNNSTTPAKPSTQHPNDNVNANDIKKPRSDKGSTRDYPTTREPRERKSSSNSTPTKAGEGTRSYSDMNGWEGSGSNYTPQVPKPYSPEDVRNFGSHGVTRTLEVLEPTTSEVAEINRILGEDLSSEQVADQNYLAQLRLYNNLVNRGMTPNESKEDFVRNAHMKNEHTINGGKYIHKCSAAGGIMYLSPSIWNKIADDRCVVCVYLDAKSNEFMYFNSIDDILEWIGEDDIVIKLTGEEKADVVEELYSGVLNGVKGTAYTLIRINSNEKYNSLFAQLPTNNDINETEENEDEY
jgi:hypothetical protein